MPTEKSNIIRRKIETGAVYVTIGETGGDFSKNVMAAVGRVFTEHYQTKSNINCASELPGSLGDLVAKNGENRRGFHYRIDGEIDCIVLMDPAAILAAATWAHEGIILEEPAPPTARVSTIDQRLAGILALEIIQEVVSGDADKDDDDPAEDANSIELIAVGVDASRFIVNGELMSSVALGLEATTMDGAALGTITLLLPDALFAQDEDADDAYAKEQAAKAWAHSMARVVSDTSIDARAIIATQNIDFKTLSGFKPGQIIGLRGASLDAVALQPENDIEGQALALGAVRSFDGLRTVQISSVDPSETAGR